MKDNRQRLFLNNAIGNLYRAALFLARSPEEKILAEAMLEEALTVLAQTQSRAQPTLLKLRRRVRNAKTKKERLILAELILDEYKRLSGIA